MKKAVVWLSVALALVLAYAGVVSVNYFRYRPTVVTRTDTVTVHHTDTLHVPIKLVEQRVRKVATVDTIYVRDTVLQVERYRYEDSIATIDYSGVSPQIDGIEYRIPRDTVKVTTERTVTRTDRRLSFGITAGPAIGYGAGLTSDAKIIGTPWVGIAVCLGINYRIK